MRRAFSLRLVSCFLVSISRKTLSFKVIFCCIDDTYKGCWKIVIRRSTILKNFLTVIDPTDPVEYILINSSRNDISVTESLLHHAEMVLNEPEETIIIISQRYHSFYIYIFYFTQLHNFFFFLKMSLCFNLLLCVTLLSFTLHF